MQHNQYKQVSKQSQIPSTILRETSRHQRRTSWILRSHSSNKLRIRNSPRLQGIRQTESIKALINRNSSLLKTKRSRNSVLSWRSRACKWFLWSLFGKTLMLRLVQWARHVRFKVSRRKWENGQLPAKKAILSSQWARLRSRSTHLQTKTQPTPSRLLLKPQRLTQPN